MKTQVERTYGRMATVQSYDNALITSNQWVRDRKEENINNFDKWKTVISPINGGGWLITEKRNFSGRK